MCSDLTDASVQSVAGSPVIQDLDIIMVTDATVGSGDDETDPDGKTTQMISTNSSRASASTAQILATNSSSKVRIHHLRRTFSFFRCIAVSLPETMHELRPLYLHAADRYAMQASGARACIVEAA